ncbi:MAG: hypothetical protein Q7T74_04725 [Candidatus Saccharibacteria bacterium]|nr:hypothetical protein [Candidatus Saccharibacteria bacterium]
MSLTINERITVVAVFADKTAPLTPVHMRWGKKQYRLGKVDFYHTTRDGHHTVHHFSLTDEEQSMYMKLAFNSGNLTWTLQETEACQ